MKSMLSLALWLSLLVGSSVLAQVPPPPSGPDVQFRDPDGAALVIFPRAETEAGRARIDRHVINYPRDPRGWSALAFAHSLEGDQQAAEEALGAARQLSQGYPMGQRRLAWSEGWTRLNLGQVPEAVRAWTQAYQLHGGRPYWIPYSLAVTAELSGERDTALAWYAQAAKDFPQNWDDAAGVQRMTRHWQPSERAAMFTLFEAWQRERKRLLALEN